MGTLAIPNSRCTRAQKIAYPVQVQQVNNQGEKLLGVELELRDFRLKIDSGHAVVFGAIMTVFGPGETGELCLDVNVQLLLIIRNKYYDPTSKHLR